MKQILQQLSFYGGLRKTKTSDGVTKNYYYDGNRLIAEKWSTGAYLLYHYDENNSIYAITYSSTGSGYAKYYLYKNLRGDVIEIHNASNVFVAGYAYDAWGNLISVSDANGNEITSRTNFAVINPIRYRGYYYDNETGFYYLNSRYYDPANCRFISADTRLDLNYGTTNLNLFAYCGNDPVNRIDYTGDEWYHWAIGGAIVVGCAIATVVTAGGFAAAAGAVTAVSSGIAAATTASTVTASAFIGSATVFGVSAITAAGDSNSISEFNSKGNWRTVASTAGGAIFNGAAAYVATRTPSSRSNFTVQASRGSTGRTEPANLTEKLAMEQVQSDPFAGIPLSKIKMNDPRWPASEGWVKMQQTIPVWRGDINIHYVYNSKINMFDDFKFKP